MLRCRNSSSVWLLAAVGLTLTVLSVWADETRPVNWVAFHATTLDRVQNVWLSPDGRLAAVGHETFSSVHIVDTRTHVLVTSIELPAAPDRTDVAFTADGKSLLTIDGQSLRSWSLPAGKEEPDKVQKLLPLPRRVERFERLYTARWRPDRYQLRADLEQVFVVEPEAGRIAVSSIGPDSIVEYFSINDSFFDAAPSGDGDTILFRLERGDTLSLDLSTRKERVFGYMLSEVRFWRFSQTSPLVYVGAHTPSSTLRIVSEANPGITVAEKIEGAFNFAVSPDGRWIVAVESLAKSPGMLRIIGTEDGKTVRRFGLKPKDDQSHTHFHPASIVEFSADGDRLFLGGDDGWIGYLAVDSVIPN
jgi:WD40 repeat protein